MKSPLQISFRSPVTLAVAVSTILLAFYNLRFWHDTAATFMEGSVKDIMFMAALFVVLLFLHASILLLVPGQRLLKIILSVLFVIAALASYSADAYGISVDKDMVRNLFETDQREAGALLNPRFFFYLFILGILPAVTTWRVQVQKMGFKRQILQRLGFLFIGTGVSAIVLFAFSAHFSSFLREHKSLRYLLSPGAALQGTIQYARSAMPDTQDRTLVDKGGITTRTAQAGGGKPLLMFLVVGETARAQNFQLAGYARPTNPELSRHEGVYYFRHVSSCGTSTAISLPCMFSHLSREKFSVASARRTTNLLDALNKAGVSVEWRDNNSGSKGVSTRIKTIYYDKTKNNTLCNDESCYDEIMLEGLEPSLNTPTQDKVIVFHQIGSHGPAYAKRYPPKFERFTPVCRTNELKQCADSEVRNAYDNSILYTDFNLGRQIDMLKSVSDRFDTALIYLSDHGESLGEKGLYLHGAPYMFAPDEQTKVPFVLWMSDGYRQRFGMDAACMQSQLANAYSHDNLCHTVLGAMAVRNDVYRPAMDMLSACRKPSVTVDGSHSD